jgi:cytochrome c peroxidase
MRRSCRPLIVLLLSTIAGTTAQAAEYPLAASTPSGISVQLQPAGPIVVGEPGTWMLEIASPRKLAGRLHIEFEAGMRAHGHGLAEAVEVRAEDAGRYVIAPVVFQMPGAWELVLTLASPDRVERLSFELTIGASERSATTDITAADLPLLRTLTLDALSVRTDPTNRFSGHSGAIDLGRALFFSPRLSADGSLSCAQCHQPERAFTDGRVTSMGRRTLTRNAPTLLGVSQHRWYYWDGRRDSLWSQALTPIETRSEMGAVRTDVVRLISEDPTWGPRFRQLRGIDTRFDDDARFPRGAGPFGDPNQRRKWERMTREDRRAINAAFADVGKLIAAFEETLQPEPTRFDRFVTALARDRDSAGRLLSAAEQRGLALFMDHSKTQCLRCHNGPLFTNYGFHAIGSDVGMLDQGFALGMQAARVDPFNCAGEFSDDRRRCASRLAGELDPDHYAGAFKVPTLRNLRATAPYFHDGRFATLEEVLAFYQSPPDSGSRSLEIAPLGLDDEETSALLAFLGALSPDPTAEDGRDGLAADGSRRALTGSSSP